jgi:putative addiction module component (TIGR02574 family)
MSLSVEQLTEQAMKLPAEERAQLADRLVASLDAAELSGIDKLWAGEARRRLNEILQGRVDTVPGEEILARARRLAEE